MGKKISFIVCLLLGICCFGMTGFAADEPDEQVELWIHTWGEDGKQVEGTQGLTFDVYDVTQWRNKREGDEKEDIEYLRNTYATKEKMQKFIQDEELKKWNDSELGVDGSGNVSFDVPRYQAGKDAAYLILASGETGKYHMTPIILYLPQKHPETDEEAKRLLIYGKYQDISKPPILSSSEPEPTSEPEPSESSSEPLMAETPKPSDQSFTERMAKKFPATNDTVQNYTILGMLFVLVGLIGIRKMQKKTKGEKR
ncbi:pilin N-terminal domain-containing protein [Enterococcus gilvus]|uniref:pilin N-terminal domain-containing protein n=1 Tax=Enterococcus gilvus TaxID=160453 RepID=UPI003D6B7ADC